MRISDWSSDVCSSDLRHAKSGQHLDPNREFSAKFGIALERVCQYPARQQRERESAAIDHAHVGRFGVFFGDRKSVVSGKSVSVSLDLGGRRIYKINNILNYYNYLLKLETRTNK